MNSKSQASVESQGVANHQTQGNQPPRFTTLWFGGAAEAGGKRREGGVGLKEGTGVRAGICADWAGPYGCL